MSKINEAISKLRVIAQALDDNDPDKIEMMNVEGDYSALVDWALRKYRERKAYAAAIKELEEHYYKKRQTHNAVADNMRGIIEMLMEAAGKRSYKSAYGTVSMAAKAQAVQVLDAAAIPDIYCKIERKPDIRVISELLKKGYVINGVTLTNGGQALHIR